MSNDSFTQPHTTPDCAQRESSSDMPNAPALAQAQSGIGTFSTVIAVSDGNFNAPQMRILQTNNNDFARLRLSVQNQACWDMASVFDRMNFFAQLHGDVMTLHSNGNLSIASTLTQGSSRTLKEQMTELSSTEALETLAHLSPVRFRYKADTEQATHVGFIAAIGMNAKSSEIASCYHKPVHTVQAVPPDERAATRGQALGMRYREAVTEVSPAS